MTDSETKWPEAWPITDQEVMCTSGPVTCYGVRHGRNWVIFDTREEAEAFAQIPVRLARGDRAVELLEGVMLGDDQKTVEAVDFLTEIEGGERE